MNDVHVHVHVRACVIVYAHACDNLYAINACTYITVCYPDTI